MALLPCESGFVEGRDCCREAGRPCPGQLGCGLGWCEGRRGRLNIDVGGKISELVRDWCGEEGTRQICLLEPPSHTEGAQAP